MKSLPEYLKVKNKVCLVYLGPSPEFLAKLVSLLPMIKRILPELQVDLYARDEFANKEIKPHSTLNPHKYGMVKNVTKNFDLEKELGIS